ncbi:MAG TPA: glycosyltransferase [Actinomycetota bacterium]|nr:glycosyltransferase [Actinomycetota bacterium]
MRILVWHGWLLEGSGSNVATARIVEVWRRAGHDVVLLCQERHPERYAWVDAAGTIDADGPSTPRPNPNASDAPGRCLLLRPVIGSLLPVFVVDAYEGFERVRSFVDLTDEELATYLRVNEEALRAAAASHRPDAIFVGHAIPGGPIGRRALGAGAYVAKIHGSDLEYAVRAQDRYQVLAGEGLGGARAIVGASADVLARASELVAGIEGLGRVVAPGVDVAAFRPRPAEDSLLDVARRLDEDPAVARGRPSSIDDEVERALSARDAAAIDALMERYDEFAPERDVATRLRAVAARAGPTVGYLGKLIPQKGVEHFLEARTALRHDPATVVVGPGSGREWLAALSIALRRGDRPAIEWLRTEGGLPLDPAAVRGPAPDLDVAFTGLLDHRYAPGVLAALDVQVVPSILTEAFGMVAAEGAAAGALPVVARHSGLAEVAAALEAEVGRPGLFSFEPGEGTVGRLARAIDRLLSLPSEERRELRDAVSSFVATHWTWERSAARLLAAAEA